MSKLMEFITLLLSYGPKLPGVLEEVEIIIAALQRLVDKLQPGRTAAAAVELTAEESEGVASVMAAAGESTEGRSGPFMEIFAWLKAHPMILEMLLKYLPLLIA